MGQRRKITRKIRKYYEANENAAYSKQCSEIYNCTFIYIYIHTHTHTYIHIYIYLRSEERSQVHNPTLKNQKMSKYTQNYQKEGNNRYFRFF